MRRFISTFVVTLFVIGSFAPLARAAGFGEKAPDFPPGAFTNNYPYSLSQFRGKVVVLFFYEQQCPTCRGLIPQRNAVVEAYKGKPVQFIAIGAGDTLQECLAYAKDTKLEMPIFADSLSVMERAYGDHISLQNIYQFKVIGADGVVMGNDMSKTAIDAALKNVTWKYKEQGYDSRLNAIVEAFEWNQFDAGMRQLRPLMKTGDKTLKESANKLFEQVKTNEGEKWKADADKAMETKPSEAFDLYSALSSVFAGDDLGKAADVALKTLKKNKDVQQELLARQAWAQMASAIPRVTAAQRQQVLVSCNAIINQYPKTPTAERTLAYAKLVEAGAK